MIAIAGVIVLAGAGLCIAVISAVAARHPDRAAMLVVLGAAGGGFLLFFLAITSVLGLGAPPPTGTATNAAVTLSPRRLVVGLTTAVMLVSAAVWLIRTGDWQRPDDASDL